MIRPFSYHLEALSYSEQTDFQGIVINGHQALYGDGVWIDWNERIIRCLSLVDMLSNPAVALHFYIYGISKRVYLFFLEQFKLRGIDGKGTLPQLEVTCWQMNSLQWTCQVESLGSYCCQSAVSHDIGGLLDLLLEKIAHIYAHHVIQHHAGKTVLSGREKENPLDFLEESYANVLTIAFRHWLVNQNKASGPCSWKLNLNHHVQDLSQELDEKVERKKIPSSLFFRRYFNRIFYIGVKSESDLSSHDQALQKVTQAWYQFLTLMNGNFLTFYRSEVNPCLFHDSLDEERIVDFFTMQYNKLGLYRAMVMTRHVVSKSISRQFNREYPLSGFLEKPIQLCYSDYDESLRFFEHPFHPSDFEQSLEYLFHYSFLFKILDPVMQQQDQKDFGRYPFKTMCLENKEGSRQKYEQFRKSKSFFIKNGKNPQNMGGFSSYKG